MIATLAIGCVLFFSGDPEPTYAGKRLNQWLGQMNQPGWGESEEAREAIRAIGTNALPFLLEWMDWEPNGLQRLVKSRQDDLPHWMRNHTFIRSVLAPYEQAEMAPAAFAALGAVAAPAIPELRKHIGPGNSRKTIHRAYLSLAGIGKPAAPVFLQALEDPALDPTNSSRIMFALHYMHSGLASLEPALLANLGRTDERIVEQTISFLSSRKLAIDPQDIMPRLIANLHHPNIEIRRAAVRAIGFYGDAAMLPTLTNALSDTDAQIRYGAQSAISEIARPYE